MELITFLVSALIAFAAGVFVGWQLFAPEKHTRNSWDVPPHEAQPDEGYSQAEREFMDIIDRSQMRDW